MVSLVTEMGSEWVDSIAAVSIDNICNLGINVADHEALERLTTVLFNPRGKWG